jgi:hypothetical protein
MLFRTHPGFTTTKFWGAQINLKQSGIPNAQVQQPIKLLAEN